MSQFDALLTATRARMASTPSTFVAMVEAARPVAYDPSAETLTYSIGYECKVTVTATSGAMAVAIMTGAERESVWGTGEMVMTREGSAEIYRIDGEEHGYAVRPQGRPW